MGKAAVEHSACGKVILCGEHSVVYGRPAIAVPVSDLRTRARVEPGPAGHGLKLVSREMQTVTWLRDAPETDTLGKAARLVLEHLRRTEPDAVLTVTSDLPVASGMGSGAAAAVAVIRALAAYLGTTLSTETVSRLAYEVEKIHHGTPSGIDNTVIAWEQPVYFVKGQTPEPLHIRRPFHLIIAHSGIAGSTREVVAEVRRRWLEAQEYYEVIFDCIGAIVNAARAAIEQGALHALGTLLNQNHELLVSMGVSAPKLDQMVAAAREAGALGAKLTGAGQGGNVIALVESPHIPAVVRAFQQAEAARVWVTACRSDIPIP